MSKDLSFYINFCVIIPDNCYSDDYKKTASFVDAKTFEKYRKARQMDTFFYFHKLQFDVIEKKLETMSD